MTKLEERFEPAIRHPYWRDVSEADWRNWRWQQRNRIKSLTDLREILQIDREEEVAIQKTQSSFRMGITPYYASLIDVDNQNCPIRQQSVPSASELKIYDYELSDPLGEEAHMPVEGITHRYPDRVLFYVTHNCPVYCRHCTRKRKVSDPGSASKTRQIQEGIRYIRNHKVVRDVLVSGGDPLSLSDERLEWIIGELRAIEHVEVIRLCTRNLATLPQRFTGKLAARLRPFQPIYVQTHFNHPRECTREAFEACSLMADHGFVISNQMVLLSGINDSSETIKNLNRRLLMMRVRPYYIFQCDMAEGLTHFRVPLDKALKIMDDLRGPLSGIGVPQLVIDLPGGGSKVPLLPEYRIRRDGKRWTFRNYQNKIFEYEDP